MTAILHSRSKGFSSLSFPLFVTSYGQLTSQSLMLTATFKNPENPRPLNQASSLVVKSIAGFFLFLMSCVSNDGRSFLFGFQGAVH